MKANMSAKDRAFRLILGMTISSFFIMNYSGWALLGLIPFITGIVGFCPLYTLIGFRTSKE